MQGFREEQEDAELFCMSLPSHADVAVCGVFDGHGGGLASVFGANNLPTELGKIDQDSLFTNSEAAHEAITNAILDVDAAFLKTEEHHMGSTAVFGLMRLDGDLVTVTVANVGDSRLLWIDGEEGTCKFATADHKPCVCWCSFQEK